MTIFITRRKRRLAVKTVWGVQRVGCTNVRFRSKLGSEPQTDWPSTCCTPLGLWCMTDGGEINLYATERRIRACTDHNGCTHLKYQKFSTLHHPGDLVLYPLITLSRLFPDHDMNVRPALCASQAAFHNCTGCYIVNSGLKSKLWPTAVQSWLYAPKFSTTSIELMVGARRASGR